MNVHRNPETPQYHHHLEKIDPPRTGTTESSAVRKSTGENLPTGAVEYHDPSTDPKVRPEDSAYYPRIPTVKPEVQSFGQILPQPEDERIPEIWTVNTQTERSSLNDSDTGESNKVRVHTHGPTRGDMAPEEDNDDDDSQSDLIFNHVTPGIRDSFENVGSVTTVVGKPIEVDQDVAYGQQQQQQTNHQHQQQQQGQNTFVPHRGAPFAHRDQEPAIVQGVPFRQDPYEGTRPYERPLIVKGKPFGVYVDGHLNVGRPYGYDQRVTRRPLINHEVVQGVPFGHHVDQKVPKPTVVEVAVPPRKENTISSTPGPVDPGVSMDLKPPPVSVFNRHQVQTFTPNRQQGNENDGAANESNFQRPEIATLPPPPSPALSPPAQPEQTSGNQSRPNTMGQNDYFDDESGSELNLAESTYQLPYPSGPLPSKPNEDSGSFGQGLPTKQQNGAKPGQDHVDLEFSMPVESTGDDDRDSDTQTERPPSMFSGTTSTRKPPTPLVTLPTSLAAPKPASEVSINRKDTTVNVHETDNRPVTQEPVVGPGSRPRPRVPYRDMMPPPLRPTIVYHGSKVNINKKNDQSEGLEPPPLPTEVVGLSPPPPKYIPLEESTTTAAKPFIVELLSQVLIRSYSHSCIDS